MKSEHKDIIERLFASFQELETAITSARRTLKEKGDVPLDIMARLNSYDDILVKQRRLAEDLCIHLHREDWDEVSRHVGLINALSALIRDDAQSVLSSSSVESVTPPTTEEKEDKDSWIC